MGPPVVSGGACPGMPRYCVVVIVLSMSHKRIGYK